MKFDEVTQKIINHFGEEILYRNTHPGLHSVIYNFVREKKTTNCLELGFFHGISSCYIAAALDENKNGGRLITIDHSRIKNLKPSIFDIASTLGLQNYIEPIFSDISYNWELMKMIEDNSVNGFIREIFDFIFIDGGHTWEDTGFAFLIAEKLLKRGGWVFFDDVLYTFAKSRESTTITESFKAYLARLTSEELNTPQVAKVIDLLVKPHPAFGEVIYFNNGYRAACQKIRRLDKKDKYHAHTANVCN